MYSVGSYVFYGNTGVCLITEIAAQDNPGSVDERLFYTLSPVYQQCTIRVPVNSDKVFMRPVISKEEAERLIDLIPTIQAEPYHGSAMSDLVTHYKQSMKSYDCEDLMTLTMSIYAKRQELLEKKRKFGVVDERFMRQAEELLFGELSVALSIPRESVTEYISERLEAAGL